MFKALVPDENDEGIILIRGVPFGGPGNRDVHGQYFTPNTNFLAHILPLPPVFHFHGAKSGSLADQIGETQSREQRRDGVWYRAKLFIDSTNDAVKTKAVQLWEAAKAGLLFASSGAVEATIKIADTGEIIQWLVGELSLIDTRNNRENPASFHATVVPVKMAEHDVETGDVTVDSLQLISVKQDDDDYDDKGNYKGNRQRNDKRDLPSVTDEFITVMRGEYENKSDFIKDMLPILRTMFGDDYILSTRSADMPDENASNDVLSQMQQRMAEMTAQMTGLQTQVNEQATQLQQRDATINELQGVISTKSAEVAMSTHVGMVDQWIKDAKLTPAEREPMLEVLSFAYQADSSVKGDVGFVNAVKGLIEARPQNPTYGNPTSIYSNAGTLNGGVTQGPGGGVDPSNISRLKRYAEISE